MPLAFPKDKSRYQAKQQQVKDRLRNWLSVKKAVFARDGRQCRACGARKDVDAHHIRFRSAGGEDSPENVAAICRSCHDDIHGYRLSVVGTNANKTLRFVRER